MIGSLAHVATIVALTAAVPAFAGSGSSDECSTPEMAQALAQLQSVTAQIASRRVALEALTELSAAAPRDVALLVRFTGYNADHSKDRRSAARTR
jgi:hypothetical protein